MAAQEDYFDSEDLDQEAAFRDDDESSDKKDDGYGESFLAPKSAFSGKNLEVGAVHKVRIESIQDEEVILKCIKSEDKEKSVSEPETKDELYD